jgi:ABC-type transport system involved in multi-copper enzyme maturation permease subunit
MRKVWQIVRIELRRKWPFAAILLLLWLFICQAFRLGIRSYYGGAIDVASDVAGPIVMLSCMIYALILGATLFQPVEKDGVRFFLYHHPVSRFHLYFFRYLTGLAIVALLSVLTASLTPSLSSTSWSQIVETTEFWHQEGWVVAFACLLVYTASAFFSPLFATDLITVPVAAAYSAAFASGGWFLAASVPLT